MFINFPKAQVAQRKKVGGVTVQPMKSSRESNVLQAYY